MSSLKSIEAKLSEVFKALPPLPYNAKESLVKAWPWIALIFGALQLLAAYSLWRLANVVERLDTLVTYYTAASPLSSGDKMVIYVASIVLLIDGVILLMAYPHLKTKHRRGWDLLFLASLVNVVYAVVQIFITARGIGSFILSLIGSAIGFYLLFQVRDKYKA
jgi:hypothetical protein